MNKALLNTVFAVAMSAVSLDVFASSDAASSMPAEQVAASFERLLNHTPADTPVALPRTSSKESDPLRAGLSAVLWEQPSYHLPIRSASLSLKPGREQ
ncbi:hypothetical protein [Herbaspirillum sp. ST 5-3]|uniref:hypothetical protein n=1 Tax=Oxalobacteraceae TaxID=75682 RepID=UPI0010A57102|nr:hypothetical protein [Herbaspirillum sp. ST 5-3]